MERQATVVHPTTPSTPEHDYYEWLCSQVKALRKYRPDFLDWSGLAEELDGMARSEEHALASFIERLLVHLLKWRYQPKGRSGSWEASIGNSRDQIEDRLSRSPSLKAQLDHLYARAYQRARRTAGAQMKLRKREWEQRFPSECPWSSDRAFAHDFWPEPAPDINGSV